MRLRTYFLFIVFFFANFYLIGSEVSKNQAQTVAINFLTERLIQSGRSWQIDNLEVIDILSVENTLYIINFKKGWVIVSSEDGLRPIIGYNYEDNLTNFEALHSNYTNYMQHFIDQIKFVKQISLAGTEEIVREWNYYLSDDFHVNVPNKNPMDRIDPLLSSKWDQDFPYNYYCPEDIDGPGGRTLVGCVATAMAQIMYYWRYPLQGSGSHSYYIYPYGTQSVDYNNSFYDYDAMQNEVDNNFPYQVAKLSYHASVSVNMDFDPEGSAAYSEDVPNALETYFNYHHDCLYQQKSNYSQVTWEEMITSELYQLRPIYYSGRNSDNSGHAFVCDGYEAGNFYHFNFGWNGSGNGYYTLQDVNGFYYLQAMVYRIFPEDTDYPYMADGATVLTSISGSFTDGSGPYDYTSNVQASWLIKPQTETDSVVNIKLSFKNISLDESDNIRVYDGGSEEAELIAMYHGDTLPPAIYSSGNELFITFSSGNTGKGFMAEYKSIMPTFCAAMETISDSSGIITDGSGKFNYRNNTSCLFRLTQPNEVIYSFDILDFDTEKDKDKITFYNKDQEILGELSGQLPNDIIHFRSNELFLMWTTNSEINKSGWTLRYSINEIDHVEELKLNNLSIYPNPTRRLLNISFDIEESERLEVQLLNMNSQILQTETRTNFKGRFDHRFNLIDYPKGVYILNIISDKGKVNKKVVLN